MKLPILTLFTLVFLTGCSLFVTQDSFGESWKGESVDSLIAQWGEPAEKEINSDGEVSVVYKIFSDTCTYSFYTDVNRIITSYHYKSTTWGTCKPIG